RRRSHPELDCGAVRVAADAPRSEDPLRCGGRRRQTAPAPAAAEDPESVAPQDHQLAARSAGAVHRRAGGGHADHHELPTARQYRRMLAAASGGSDELPRKWDRSIELTGWGSGWGLGWSNQPQPEPKPQPVSQIAGGPRWKRCPLDGPGIAAR